MGIHDHKALQYLAEAELICSAEEVEDAIDKVASQLNQDYAGAFPVVLCVMGGAVVFTGQLLSKLTFPLEFDYVQATRYHATTHGRELQWKIKPSALINNRDVLIVDDILDEGITLKAVVDECLKLGANQVKVAVLADKQLDIKKPIIADYIGLKVPNRYVFGCGMDVYGWWRNLPAIYALPVVND